MCYSDYQTLELSVCFIWKTEQIILDYKNVKAAIMSY